MFFKPFSVFCWAFFSCCACRRFHNPLLNRDTGACGEPPQPYHGLSCVLKDSGISQRNGNQELGKRSSFEIRLRKQNLLSQARQNPGESALSFLKLPSVLRPCSLQIQHPDRPSFSGAERGGCVSFPSGAHGAASGLPYHQSRHICCGETHQGGLCSPTGQIPIRVDRFPDSSFRGPSGRCPKSRGELCVHPSKMWQGRKNVVGVLPHRGVLLFRQ